MSPTICETQAGALRLEGPLDLYAAEMLRALLIDRLDTGDAGALDLAGVTACDTAGVQLLLAAQATVAARGRVLRLVAVPESVGTAFFRLGLPTPS